MSKPAVVCQQQQSLSIEIQASDRMDFVSIVPQQVDDQRALVRIGAGGQNAERFVEQEVNFLLIFEPRVDQFAAHFYVILFGISLDAEFGHNFTIELDL